MMNLNPAKMQQVIQEAFDKVGTRVDGKPLSLRPTGDRKQPLHALRRTRLDHPLTVK
jgi:hypothetical protein